MDFRRTNNYGPNVQRFERRVRQSMCTVDIPKAQTWGKVADKIAVLPKRRVRKYRRKANEYKKAYRIIDKKVEGEKGAGAATYVDIEKLRKKIKSHRCTEYQDYAFLQKNYNIAEIPSKRSAWVTTSIYDTKIYRRRHTAVPTLSTLF
jgi:hypothetical protein